MCGLYRRLLAEEEGKTSDRDRGMFSASPDLVVVVDSRNIKNQSYLMCAEGHWLNPEELHPVVFLQKVHHGIMRPHVG